MNLPTLLPPRSAWVFDPSLSSGKYVRRLLDGYCRTPSVVGVIRPADQRLAEDFYRRSIPLALVEAAFALTAARRLFRVPPLVTPIRSLHYFLPVLNELADDPPAPEYFHYLRWKLRNSERCCNRLGASSL
jgi:hypothetical protein